VRTIQVSTAVFAAIWAARSDGEDGEDAILWRILNLPAAKPDPKAGERASEGAVVGLLRYAFQLPCSGGFRNISSVQRARISSQGKQIEVAFGI